jgi:tetratricopeptide (TPR) repeat protein
MLGALFRIEKVIEDKNDGVWVVRLTIASEDDYQLKETIGDDTNLDSLGKILIGMGEYEQARKCDQKMLDKGNHIVGNVESGLAMAYLDCNREDKSLDHLEKALQIRQSVLGSDHADVGECYGHIGTVQRDYKKALFNLTKGMKIQEKTLPPDSLPLAKTYGNVTTAIWKSSI